MIVFYDTFLSSGKTKKKFTHLFDKDFLTARLSHKVKYPQLTQSLFEIRLKSKHTEGFKTRCTTNTADLYYQSCISTNHISIP